VARLTSQGESVTDIHFLPVVRAADGQIHLALRGQSAKPYLLQASSDLSQWVIIATNNHPHIPIGFIDSSTVTNSERFYRIAIP
jgi:hypothetical protein